MTSTDRALAEESTGDVPARELALRMLWITLRLILVYCLADEFQPFFYQAF